MTVKVTISSDGNIAVCRADDERGLVLEWKAGEWDAFLRGVKAGEFDFDELE